MGVTVFLLKKGMVVKLYSMFLCLRSHQPQVRNLGPAHGPAFRSVLALGMKKLVPGPQCKALRVPGARRTPLLCLNTPGQAAAGGVSQRKVQRSIAARACPRSLPRAPKSFPGAGGRPGWPLGVWLPPKWGNPGLRSSSHTPQRGSAQRGARELFFPRLRGYF